MLNLKTTTTDAAGTPVLRYGVSHAVGVDRLWLGGWWVDGWTGKGVKGKG